MWYQYIYIQYKQVWSILSSSFVSILHSCSGAARSSCPTAGKCPTKMHHITIAANHDKFGWVTSFGLVALISAVLTPNNANRTFLPLVWLVEGAIVDQQSSLMQTCSIQIRNYNASSREVEILTRTDTHVHTHQTQDNFPNCMHQQSCSCQNIGELPWWLVY